MQILVDPANYDLRNSNLGCLAVLQAGLRRIAAVFPEARVQMLTTHPDALLRLFPTVEPIPIDFKWEWYRGSPVLERCQARLPSRVKLASARLRTVSRMGYPRTLSAWLQAKRWGARGGSPGFRGLTTALNGADLLVVTGLGGLRGIEVHALRSLEAAIGRGIPTAMLGLGLSGEHTDLLMAQMQAVLPRVDLIAVRERRTAPALLRSLGARSDRVFVTGDDAIALAFERHPTKLGGALGINLRVMRSAEVDESMIDRLRPILHAFAREHATALVPLPGAHGNLHPDSDTLRALLAGWDDESDGGSGLTTPVQIMEQAGRCRLVVTGAYHVAVFALAQGVPVVCLARSAYFTDKLSGLADMFGPGCRVVDLAAPRWDDELRAAMAHGWTHADELRPSLLAAAAAQDAAGMEFLQRRVRPLVDGRIARRAAWPVRPPSVATRPPQAMGDRA